MKNKNVLIFFHHDVVSDQSNPRITSYISYLAKQGFTPCFRFVTSNRMNRVGYILHYFHLLTSTKYRFAYYYSPNALAIPMYLICRLRGIKVVIEKTELDSIKPKEGWKDHISHWLYKLDEMVFPLFCNKLIVISQRLHLLYENRVNQIQKVGAFIEASHKLSDNTSILKDAPFSIGYMGSFGQKDDLQTILKAFSTLRDSVPHPIQLNLYGQNISSSITESPGVVSHGFLDRSRIHETLLGNHVLVALRTKHVYSDFGFPSKLTEYFVTGRPVITSNSSDITSLFEDKKEVLLVEPENVKQVVNELNWCFNNKDAANKIGEQSKQWALTHWNSQVVLSQWYQFVVH